MAVRPPFSRIVLVGFMGAGKTSVGRALARLVRWGFRDFDEWIEAREGLSVARIFAERGEPAFRALEFEAARQSVCLERFVLAPGGGAFPRPETRSLLAAGAVSVHLRCRLEVLARRVGSDPRRPLASNHETMRALFAEREGAYALADLCVDGEAGLPEVIALGIARELGLL